MANDYFQFRQFTIRQDRCSMKVATDSCILGAYFAQRLHAGQRVLDIGSGTGLLMLMLAQKNALTLHGIELDPEAFGQLQENIEGSPWKDACRAIAGDVRDMALHEKYDFIITNPPFFENALRSPSARKNLARHDVSLGQDELIGAIDRNLEDRGSFGILLPYQRKNSMIAAAREKGFHLLESLSVRQRPGRDFFRVILRFSREPCQAPAEEKLSIQDEHGIYSEDFIRLLKDYYLYL